MNIDYSDYAEETLKDRRISKESVELALLEPDELVEGKKGRKIAHRQFGNKLLRVVFEADGDIIIDKAKDNKIVAIEILDASEKIPATEIRKVTVGASE